MEIVGAIAVTLVLGYLAAGFAFYAMCCLLGFDEVNIPVGMVFFGLLIGDIITWWFIVGQHIHIDFG